MARSIAALSGVAIKPGISKNGRYYSPDMVADAVARAQERLAAQGSEPFVMLTHHDAEDDSEKIVGRITGWKLGDDGAALYDAVMPNTPEAKKILDLIDTEDGTPFLEGVSIRGYWLGPITRTTVDGISCDTAEGLELDGLDFTRTPGVAGARVNSVTRSAAVPVESAAGRVRHRIVESAPEAHVVTVTEDAAPAAVTPAETSAPAEVSAEKWADHGYTDAGKRWPLDTPGQARESWRRIHRPAVVESLTAKQLSRVRERARVALARHGVEVLPNGWLLERAKLTPPAVREELAWFDGAIDISPATEPASFTARIDNGTVCVCVSSYNVDPHDLTRVARAAMAGAADTLDALDPDADGDIDTDTTLPGESAPADAPEAVEEATEAVVAEEAPTTETAPAEAPTEPSTEAASVASDSSTENEEEPVVTEPTANTPEAPAAEPMLSLSQVEGLFKTFAAAMAPAAAPVESAPAAAAPVTETAAPAEAAPVTEAPAPVETKTNEQLIAEAVEAGRRAGLQEAAEQGLVGARKGAVVAPAGVRESDGLPEKPLHEYNDQERKALRRAMGAELATELGIRLPDES